MPPGTQPPVKLGKVRNAQPSSLRTRSVIVYSAMGFGDAPLTRWHCTTLRTRLLRLPSYSWASRMSSAATGSLLPRRQAPVAPPSTHRRRRRCVDSFPPNRPTTVTSPSILGHSTAPSSWPAWVGNRCAAGLEPRVRGARHSPPQDRQPLPVEGAQPRYLQLYFYHRERETRASLFDDLQPEVIRQLQNMLHQSNAYVRGLRSAMDMLPPGDRWDIKIVINAQRRPANEHERRQPSGNRRSSATNAERAARCQGYRAATSRRPSRADQ